MNEEEGSRSGCCSDDAELSESRPCFRNVAMGIAQNGVDLDRERVWNE